MAPAKDNWLGPRLEEELKAVIEWRRRDNDPALSSQSMAIDEHNYSYDGSNLWVNVEYVIEDPVVVQVQQFMKNKHPFNCLVCDGFTTVRAKFSKEAAIKLQNHSKFDNLAKLSSQAILNIPKFRIMVTPSGSDSDRIQLLIDYVGIVNSQKVDDSGNPRPFHLRTGVATLLKQVELLMHPRSESEAPENLPTQRRTRVMKNGYYTQEFATQIRPSLQGAGFEMLGGANLAPPVVPHRNDGAKVFGMQSMTRENNQNAYDNLMSLMPDVITTTKTASAVVSATQPFASQPPSQITPNVTHNESNEEGDSDLGDNASEEVVDLTRSQSSNSRPLVRPQVDGTVEDAIKRMNNYSYGNPHWHEMDEHEMMSHVGGNRGPVADIARDPITAHPQNEQASGVSNNKDREIETSRQAGSPKLPIVRQHNDRDKDRDTRTLPQTPSRREARPVPPGRDVMQKFKPRSWANILLRGTKRSDFVCPDNQVTLLMRPESENHPRPGKTFPSANIPIELLTQLQKTPVSSSRPGAHVPNEDANMEEDPSGNEDDDEEDDEDEPSGGNDDEDEDDDDEIIAEFTPTPEKAILTDNLPPESSPPPPIRPKAQSVARNAIWNASQISSGQRRTVVGEPVITPADRDHEMDIDQPPKSVDTARMFSSAVRPETILPGIQREPKKSNDSQSTLSSGNFPDSSYSLLPRTQRLSIHRKGSQHISSTNDFPVSSQGLLPGTQLQPNTIHGPLTQSSGNNISGSVRIMRPPPTRLVSAGHLDGVDSDLPSEVTTAMAEQQLLHDFKASVHQSSDDVQAPATPARLTNRRRSQRNSPASSMATSRKRRVPPEMSPKELREQKLSRFNFTQESPVSQDPAVSAAKARENFLKGRKNQKQIQQPEIPSSPPRVESAPSVAMEDSRSLYTEFRRAYPNYTGTNEHFETMCKKLAASCKMEQLLCHPILWDDFIARSVSDYLDYAQKKLLAAETLEPYEKFYNEQIEGSLHEKKVVTRAKLVAWLGPEALYPSARMDSRGPKRHGNNERSVSGQQHSTGNMGGLDSAPIKQEGQAAKRANPWQNANKAPKGSEWWRKP